MEILMWIVGLAAFLVVLSASVAVHEAGHMVTAKKLGVPVPKFFVGFGPTLWSKKFGETEYGVKALPLGGFIAVEDTTQPEGSPARALLSYVSPWRRILIFLAGPAVNIVIGVAVLFMYLMINPVQSPTLTVDHLRACTQTITCPAQQAGIKAGDTIVAVNGNKVNSFNEMKIPVGKESTFTVNRAGTEVNVKVSPDAQGLIGMYMTSAETHLSAGQASQKIMSVFESSLTTIGNIPSQVPVLVDTVLGKTARPADSPSSVVGIGRAYGEVASTEVIPLSQKWDMFVVYSAMLNIGLGVANLIPMIPLDGGRIFVALLDSLKILWARIRRKAYSPVGETSMFAMTMVMGATVIAYMGLLIVVDIVSPLSIF